MVLFQNGRELEDVCWRGALPGWCCCGVPLVEAAAADVVDLVAPQAEVAALDWPASAQGRISMKDLYSS